MNTKSSSRLTVAMIMGAMVMPVFAQEQSQGTMTVERLFELVEENSISLQVAKSGVEAAGHGVAAAKSERLPDIDASLSFSYIGNVLRTDRDFGDAKGFSSPHFGNSFTLEVEQMIYSGGALMAGVKMAKIEKSQAETGVTATRNAQRFLAMAQYLELMEADNAIRVYESNIALTDQLIEDIKVKRSQGMALKNEITRYELQMETLRLGLRRMHDRRSVLNHQLCNTLGIDTDEWIMPDTTLMELSREENEWEWQNRALISSPDLLNAELSSKVAEQQLELVKSERRPKLVVFATDNFNGPYTYDIPPIDYNFNIWYVGVGIRYSLSSLFKSNKRVRKANVELRKTQEVYSRTAEEIDNRMNEAYTLYLQAFEDLRTRRKSAQLARENYEVVNNRYLNDLALITDMTDASNIRLSAELDETNARIQIVYAYYRMKYIAGEI